MKTSFLPRMMALPGKMLKERTFSSLPFALHFLAYIWVGAVVAIRTGVGTVWSGMVVVKR